MSKYTVKFYEGEYDARQEAANADDAIVYFEQHLNSKEYDDPASGDDNPIMALVAHNASKRSIEIAAEYVRAVRQRFTRPPMFQGGPEPGVYKVPFRGRGDFNLRLTKMPAVLLEPLWISDQLTAEDLLHGTAVRQLAMALVDTVESCFPRGGLIAFSIGHLGKPSAPFDRGAPVTKKVANPFGLAEADLSKLIMQEAARELRIEPEPAQPTLEQRVAELEKEIKYLKIAGSSAHYENGR